MIYVSSSCVKASTIAESVQILVDAGFKNIELSGGTRPYPSLEEDLLNLKDQNDLNFLCHNYFPPPSKDFVLNLASLDPEVEQLSLEHCQKAIDLSAQLGGERFAFHAGFLINIPVNQIGKRILKKDLFNREEALSHFHKNLDDLINYANGRLKLYIENNVISKANYEEFGEDPFFFTSSSNLSEARGHTSIGHLLDLAHLRVSCNSLGLDFSEELSALIEETDYIHLSDNNGEADLNWALSEKSEIFQSLQNYKLKGKVITLETYSDLEEIRRSYELIEGLL